MKTTLPTVLALCATWAAAAPEPQTIRLRDLPSHVGEKVTLKGRTGQIVEDEERPGLRVYTFRDDYGDMVKVHTSAAYPTFGATYFLTGSPEQEAASGALHFREASRRQAFPARKVVVREEVTVERTLSPLILAAVAALVLLGVLAVVVIVRRRMAGAALPPEWGYAEITAGPHQGRALTLRADEVLVGRGVDTTLDLDLPLDVSVSRKHGRLFREDGVPHYEDLGSSHGSWVNEQQLQPNQPVSLPPGALIRLGPATVIRVGPVEAAAGETQFAGSEQAANWGERETQRAEP